MDSIKELLGEPRWKELEAAPLAGGTRHPTWFALQTPSDRPADVLVDQAVRRVARVDGGTKWLADLVPRLIDLEDPSNASSALAEMRAYGALLESGFKVAPISRQKGTNTPDFTINAGDGRVVVEVFAKHQDRSQDVVVEAIHSPLGTALPPEVERTTHVQGERSITFTTGLVAPFGQPDPKKAGDSIQANAVQRLCGIKSNEKQLPSDAPVLLVVDFVHFGGPHASSFVSAEEAWPVMKGHHGLSCGPLWYAMYG